MNDKIIKNILNSVLLVANDNCEGVDDIISQEYENSDISTPLRVISSAIYKTKPVFDFPDNTMIECYQQSIFGFFVLINMIRNIFMGTRFLQSGDILIESNHYSSAIMCYYTAAYHHINAFLSTNGYTIIERIEYIKEKPELDIHRFFIFAKLLNNGTWGFEFKKKSHYRRWNTVEDLFLKDKVDIPDFFMEFFNYLSSYGPYQEDDENISIKKGIEKLRELRHDSIYKVYGYDDFAFDGLMNQDYFVSPDALRAKSSHYSDFAHNLLDYNLDELFLILEKIPLEIKKTISNLILLNFNLYPFELGEQTIKNKPKTTENLNELLEMIFIDIIDK